MCEETTPGRGNPVATPDAALPDAEVFVEDATTGNGRPPKGKIPAAMLEAAPIEARGFAEGTMAGIEISPKGKDPTLDGAKERACKVGLAPASGVRSAAAAVEAAAGTAVGAATAVEGNGKRLLPVVITAFAALPAACTSPDATLVGTGTSAPLDRLTHCAGTSAVTLPPSGTSAG